MSLPYDVTTNIGKVRLVIGDTDATDYVFSDDELNYFLTKNSNSINMAAADALEAWAAKYAASPDSEKIGDYAYTQKGDKMLKLAASFRETEASTPVLEISTMDLTGVEDTTVSEDVE